MDQEQKNWIYILAIWPNNCLDSMIRHFNTYLKKQSFLNNLHIHLSDYHVTFSGVQDSYLFCSGSLWWTLSHIHHNATSNRAANEISALRKMMQQHFNPLICLALSRPRLYTQTDQLAKLQRQVHAKTVALVTS